jgi:flavin-binding protein dodecin
MPWFFHAWSPDVDTSIEDETLRDRSPTAELLRRRGERLDPLLCRYLEACLEAPFSFHEILRAEPGNGFLARDVITGEEREVLERSGSERMQAGDLLFGQLVDIDGIVMLEASAPVLIPPGDKIYVIELRKRVMSGTGAASRERLRDWDIEIRELYLWLAELRNTDGELLVPHRVIFEVDSAQSAFDALKHLALDDSDEALLSSAEHDSGGQLRRLRINWTKPKNRMHASWENTILGSIDIDGARLVGEVNSAERAAELERIIEEALGSRARHRATEIQTVESALAAAGDNGRRRAADTTDEIELAELPEVQARIGELMAAHYEEWVTAELPALADRTPLEAVKDPDGREAVEALLAQIERGGQGMKPPIDSILRRLRERLGLAT